MITEALSGAAASSPDVNWSTVCDWFNSFRFVLTVPITSWIFVRGVTPKRDHYRLRILMLLPIGLLLTVANPLYVNISSHDDWQGPATTTFVNVWIPAVFLFGLAFIKLCRLISWTNAISRWLLGLCVERFITAFAHNWLFFCIIPNFKTEFPLEYMEICVFTYGLSLSLSAIFLAPQFSREVTMPSQSPARAKHMLLLLYILSFIALYVVSNASMGISEKYINTLREDLANANASGNNESVLNYILYFSTGIAGLVAVLIFLSQYALYHIAELQQESTLLKVLADQKSRQFDTITANIDYMNRKTHDLKHQIAALEFTEGSRRSQLVQDVQQSLDIYDATANTGNDALDTLITERNFFCARNNIRMTCTLAGCDWNAIDVVDLYTILGNALDNACDYVMRFDNPDKRVVSVSARQQGNLIVLSVDNHFEGSVKIVDGLPVTTKRDKASHGLGLKSIRSIARRYGGDVLVTAREPIFTLQVSLMV